MRCVNYTVVAVCLAFISLAGDTIQQVVGVKPVKIEL